MAFRDLSDELVLLIFSYLDIPELFNISRVCGSYYVRRDPRISGHQVTTILFYSSTC